VTEMAIKRTSLLLLQAGDAGADLFDAMLEQVAPWAFEVVRTTTLAGAMSYLETRIAECIVVDLGLPDAEGLEVIETLATIAPTAALIVLTDSDDSDLGLTAIETGASDYLSKR
jgi:DNA-binding NarL/FixJ family response regulator